MSNAAAAALASLGLSAAAPVEAAAVEGAHTHQVPVVSGEAVTDTVVVAPAEVGAVEAVVGTVAPVEAASTAPAFAAGEVVDIALDAIPELTRNLLGGGSRPSLYGIETLAAPGTDGKPYHAKLIPFTEGDVVKFRRSVQGSASNLNTKAEEDGSSVYYSVRQHKVEGKYVGQLVIRTDARPTKEEEASEQQSEA